MFHFIGLGYDYNWANMYLPSHDLIDHMHVDQARSATNPLVNGDVERARKFALPLALGARQFEIEISGCFTNSRELAAAAAGDGESFSLNPKESSPRRGILVIVADWEDPAAARPKIEAAALCSDVVAAASIILPLLHSYQWERLDRKFYRSMSVLLSEGGLENHAVWARPRPKNPIARFVTSVMSQILPPLVSVGRAIALVDRPENLNGSGHTLEQIAEAIAAADR